MSIHKKTYPFKLKVPKAPKFQAAKGHAPKMKSVHIGKPRKPKL